MKKERPILLCSLTIVLMCLLTISSTFQTICVKTLGNNYLDALTINQIVDQKIAVLNQEEMIIISGNKLFDSFMNMKLEQLKLEHITPTIIVSIQDISFIDDEHLNIIISYLFDIAMNCIQNNELEIKAIQDECVFEIAIFISQGIENIDRVKYDTLKLILKRYQGSIKIIHENQNINISLLIPVSR